MLGGLSAVPASASGPVVTAARHWGWEQLDLSSMEPWRAAAVRDALKAAQPVGVVDARRQALALLVTAGTVTPGQADLLAMINSPSVIDALVQTKHFTKAQGEAVKQVVRGFSMTQARYSSAKIALEMLTSSGLLSSAQADLVRNQLVKIH